MTDAKTTIRWGLMILGFWTVPVVLGLCRCVYVAGPDAALVPPLGRVFLVQAAEWYPWALLTPAVWLLGRRFRPPHLAWRVAIPIHLFLGLAVCVAYALLSAPGRSLAQAEPSAFTFLERVGGLLVNTLQVHYLIYWAVLGAGFVLFTRRPHERVDVPERIAIKTPGEVAIVRLADIQFVSAADQYVQIQAGDRELLSRESLAEMEKRLPRENFYRIHRSTIVNLRHIERLESGQHGEYTVVLHGGRSLRASRSRSSGLRELLAG